MDIATLSLLLLAGLFVFLIAGVPLGFATGLLGGVVIAINFGAPGLGLVMQRVYDLVITYAVIAVPLFIVMASLLERSGIAKDMYDALNLTLGRRRGGVAVVTTVMAVIMAAMSGIIGGEIVLLGLVALPQMLRLGYDKHLAIGTICAGGSLGTMIPPSVVLIIYGIVTETSITKLFTAAFVPGLMLATVYILYIIIRTRLQPHLAPLPSELRAAAAASASAAMDDKGVSGGEGLTKGDNDGAAELERSSALVGEDSLTSHDVGSSERHQLMPAGAARKKLKSVETDDNGGVTSRGVVDIDGDGDKGGAASRGVVEIDEVERPLHEFVTIVSPFLLGLFGLFIARANGMDGTQQIAALIFVSATAGMIAVALLRNSDDFPVSKGLLPPLIVVDLVLGSIYGGVTGITEAAAMGVVATFLLITIRRELSLRTLLEGMEQTFRSVGTILWVTFGATVLAGAFSLSGGNDYVAGAILDLDISPLGVIFMMMLVFLVLGMFMDWIGIVLLTMPVFIPIVKELGYDPIWFGILFSINMQVAFLTPPFGSAAFYLKSVVPPEIDLVTIYRSFGPFICLQLLVLMLVLFFPWIALFLVD